MLIAINTLNILAQHRRMIYARESAVLSISTVPGTVVLFGTEASDA